MSELLAVPIHSLYNLVFADDVFCVKTYTEKASPVVIALPIENAAAIWSDAVAVDRN